MAHRVTYENDQETLVVSVVSDDTYLTIKGVDGKSTTVLLEDIEDLVDYVRHAEGWFSE